MCIFFFIVKNDWRHKVIYRYDSVIIGRKPTLFSSGQEGMSISFSQRKMADKLHLSEFDQDKEHVSSCERLCNIFNNHRNEGFAHVFHTCIGKGALSAAQREEAHPDQRFPPRPWLREQRCDAKPTKNSVSPSKTSIITEKLLFAGEVRFANRRGVLSGLLLARSADRDPGSSHPQPAAGTGLRCRSGLRC